jgi:hypothetical protein
MKMILHFIEITFFLYIEFKFDRKILIVIKLSALNILHFTMKKKERININRKREYKTIHLLLVVDVWLSLWIS